MFKSFIDKEKIINLSNEFMTLKICHITDNKAKLSEGNIHDYYSNGDYWWPNPNTKDGLPFVVRDGESYPHHFFHHRNAIKLLRKVVTNLTLAYTITNDIRYGKRAVQWLEEFFLNKATYMSPHLSYSQAIPGVCSGRGIGIIDTLHLVEIPQAITLLKDIIPSKSYIGLRNWFSDYLNWMNTHPYGIEERDWANNHSVTWHVQACAFANFTENKKILNECRHRFKTVLLPNQMDIDGSFPLELKRTKPYGYSLFVLDNMANICLFVSNENDDLWNYESEDGKSILKGMNFLLPYIKDKSKWPYNKDIEHFDAWPVAMPFMLFAYLKYKNKDYQRLYNTLDKYPTNEEILRNIAIHSPSLYLL